MAHVTFFEFKTREGLMCLQRADQISTILESTLTVKGGPSRTILYLMLNNNNRVEVVGETRQSIMDKFMAANSTFPAVILQVEPSADPAEEPVEAAAE